jgi:hypothetical protein
MMEGERDFEELKPVCSFVRIMYCQELETVKEKS